MAAIGTVWLGRPASTLRHAVRVIGTEDTDHGRFALCGAGPESSDEPWRPASAELAKCPSCLVWVQATQPDEALTIALAELARLRRAILAEQTLSARTIAERDEYQLVADQLAAEIARITDTDIGEHANDCDPWGNALMAARAFPADGAP